LALNVLLTARMKNPTSALHYNAPVQPKVSKWLALVVFAGVAAVAVFFVTIVH
jgi:hypothetical protein